MSLLSTLSYENWPNYLPAYCILCGVSLPKNKLKPELCQQCASGDSIKLDAESQLPFIAFTEAAYNTDIGQGEGFTNDSIDQPRVPFLITCDQAIKVFKSWQKHQDFSSAQFKSSTIDGKPTAHYLACYLFNADASAQYEGQEGYKPRSIKGTSDRHYRWTEAKGNVIRQFIKILVTSSKRVGQGVLEELAPWPLSLRSTEHRACDSIVKESIDTRGFSAYNSVKAVIKRVLTADALNQMKGNAKKIDSMMIERKAISFQTLHLPVWVVDYTIDNQKHSAFINGATGKITGKPAIAKKRMVKALIAYVVVTLGAGWLLSLAEPLAI